VTGAGRKAQGRGEKERRTKKEERKGKKERLSFLGFWLLTTDY
jgi:hypothetical protein